ncbi:unnamed protein product [Prorocentrum cordatum]|uniref:Uncharacterized protein n=1 Tax=Prorocentrum cordatum TaxID=2364126 RepID=A0ABN9PVC3_9DINO|nr:unnamed protein product [Polarella glacialis]
MQITSGGVRTCSGTRPVPTLWAWTTAGCKEIGLPSVASTATTTEYPTASTWVIHAAAGSPLGMLSLCRAIANRRWRLSHPSENSTTARLRMKEITQLRDQPENCSSSYDKARYREDFISWRTSTMLPCGRTMCATLSSL